MAATVTELAGLFGSFGLSNILIQRRVVTRLQMDTVFWTGMGVGATLACAVFLASFVAARFFGDPITGELLRVLCLTFVIGSLSLVPDAIIARMMWFRLEFGIAICVILCRSTVAIALAYSGLGVWSLVAGGLAGAAAGALIAFLAVPYLPRVRFHRAYLASNWRTGGGYFGSSVLYYINMNVDLILIGRHLGAAVLGYYQNARSLTDEVRGRLAMPLQRVLFPAYSTMQDDRPRLQRTVLHSGRLLAAIIIPIGVGISAVADEVVRLLYGPQWLDMIPVIGWFGIGAAIRGSTAIASPLFNSQDRVALSFRYNLIGTIITVAAVLSSLPFGIRVISISVTLAALYALVPFVAGFRLIGLRLRDALQMIGPPTVAAGTMWLSVYVLRLSQPQSLGEASARLGAHVGCGAIVYALVLHTISRRYLRDFLDVGRRLVRPGNRHF